MPKARVDLEELAAGFNVARCVAQLPQQRVLLHQHVEVEGNRRKYQPQHQDDDKDEEKEEEPTEHALRKGSEQDPTESKQKCPSLGNR